MIDRDAGGNGKAGDRIAFGGLSRGVFAIAVFAVMAGCSANTADVASTYGVSSSSLAENCKVFSAVTAHDNLAQKRSFALNEETAETVDLYEEILPGGPYYAESVKGVGEADNVSRELADAAMRHYHVSRIKRGKGDVVGESAELLKSSLNQTSYVELAQTGRFSLGPSPNFGSYLPAVCRMQTICRTREAERHLMSPRCKAEW